MNRNVTAIILIAIAAGIYFTYTQGQIDKDRALLVVGDQYKTAIVNANKLTEIRESVQASFNNISLEDRVRLDRMIPSSVDNIHLIVDVSKLGNRKGVVIRNLKADTSSNNTPSVQPVASSTNGVNQSARLPNMTLGTIRLSFDVTASYAKFIDFMQDLEKNLRIMDVNKITIKATDTGIYDFSVDVSTYWLKQ